MSTELTHKPVIVRDLFWSNIYHAYLPADDKGKYWWKQDFRVVSNSATGNKNKMFPMGEGFFGRLIAGKAQTQPRANSEDLNPDPVSGWDLQAHATEGKFIEWIIPDGHDRIQVIIRTRSMYGIWQVSLGSTTGASDLNGELDSTTIDLTTAGQGFDNSIDEIVIATNASSSGEKYIRFTVPAGGKSCYIVGVRSFDTDSTGDPSTVNGTDSLVEGHDLITMYEPDVPIFSPPTAAVSGFSDKILKNNTCEFTMNWAPDGNAGKWTSYGRMHYGAGEADFTPTQFTTLFINEVEIGAMHDTGVVPAGTIYADSRIYLHVEGFGDYDENGLASPDATDTMNCTIGTALTTNGIAININIGFDDDTDVSTIFIPSVTLVDDTTGHVVFLPDSTKYNYAGGAGTTYDIAGAVQSRTSPDDVNCDIIASAASPIQRTYKQTSDAVKVKQYFDVNFEVLPDGANPTSSTAWSLGANLSVRRRAIKHGVLVK